MTAAQIYHQPAVAPRSQGRAGACLHLENLGEAVAHRIEPLVSMSLNFHPAIMAPSSASGSAASSRPARIRPAWQTEMPAWRKS